jgi:hypothetical protein
MRKVIALFLGGLVCLPTMARAEKERKSPLTDAPVIRKRLELRDKRFELGVGAGVSIGQDFTNALLIMPKLAYHFNDWLALAAVGGFNLTPGWKSTFNSDIHGQAAQAGQKMPYKSPHPDEAALGDESDRVLTRPRTGGVHPLVWQDRPCSAASSATSTSTCFWEAAW